MKRYLRTEWHHDHADEPVLLLSEVEGGFEVRKVEAYRDGHMDYADATCSTGSTVLAEGLMPRVEDISSDDQFTPDEISAEEFEEIWQQATAH